MKISSKGEYGIRALFHLALHYGEGPIQSKEIAKEEAIPENYLDQLLIILRKAGLVKSRRGPQGGHFLARPPAQISLGEALAVLEGSTAPMACVEEGAKIDCPLAEACILRDIWRELKQATDRILDTTTLDDMCRSKLQREGLSMYYI